MKTQTIVLAIAVILVLSVSCRKQEVIPPSYNISVTVTADNIQSTVVKISPLRYQDGSEIANDQMPSGDVLLVMSPSKEMQECETLIVNYHSFGYACIFTIDQEKRPLDKEFWFYIELQAPYSKPIRSELFVMPIVPRNSFLTANGEYIQFAPGNLQYQASTGTWRFAENQYDVIGEGN